MAVEISSIKVTAALDAQAYVAGANAKAAADQKMVASGTALGASLTDTDRKLGTSTTALTRLARAIDPTFNATQKMAQGLRTLQRALELGPEKKGGIGLEEHARLLDLLKKKYGDLAAPMNDNTRALDAQTAALLRSSAAINQRLNIRDDFGTKDRAEDIAAYGRELDAIRAKHSPLFAAQQQYRDRLRELNTDLKTGAINQAEWVAALQRVKTAFTAQIQTLTGAAAAAKEKALADKQAAAEGQKLANSAQSYKDRLNPLLPLQRNYRAELGQINTLAKAGLLSDEQRTASIRRTKEAFASNVTTLQAAAAAHKNVQQAQEMGTVSAKQLRFAVFDLGFQINDIATSLASGARPMQVFAQQTGQIVGAIQLAGGPTALFGAFASAIGKLFTPFRIAAVAAGAVAVGFGALMARAADTEASIRRFSVVLSGLGIGSLDSAKDLEAAAKRLRDVGLSISEAREQLTTSLRAGFEPRAGERIARAGVDISAVLGEGGADTLRTALKGGIEDTIQLGLALQAFTPKQAAAWREMARGGESARALGQAFQIIENHVKGLAEEAMSPVAKAARDLNVAWKNMLDTMANSAPIQAALEVMTSLTNAIDRLIKGQSTAADVSKLGGTVAGAVAGAAAGRPGGFWGMVSGALLGGVTGYGAGAAVAPTGPAASSMIYDPTEREALILAEIKRRESRGDYTRFHATGAVVTSLADVEAFGPGFKSHAFGGYGFQPGTYREMAALTGQYGISPGAQDINALQLLRRRGTRPWDESGPYNVTTGPGGELTINRQNYAQMDNSVNKLTKSMKDELEVRKLIGEAADVLAAKQAAEAKAIELGLDPKARDVLVSNAIIAAKEKINIETRKAIEENSIEIRGQNLIADAYLKSAEAGMDAASQLQAQLEIRRTYGNEIAKSAEGERLVARRLIELQADRTAKQRIANAQAIGAQKEQAELLQLQIGLVGQTTEEITRQVTLKQTMQTLDRERPNLAKEEKQAMLEAVDATQRQAIALAEAQRNWQRVEDSIRSIANTIDTTLTRSIEDAFSGKQAESWSVRIKQIMGQIAGQISSAFFIKPLMGTLAAAFGLGNLASQFGSFGDLFGGGGGGGTGQVQLTDAKGNVFTLGNASSALSIGKNLFGDSFGGFGSFFNNIGASLGFGQTVSGLGASSIADISSLIGIEQSSLGFLGNSFTVPGSLFGTTTLGSFAGGIGAGIGGGMLLNNLLGGKTTGGTIGSVGGSIAGTIIGSLLGGPIIGGLLGGLAGGALGGMFGPKPSNFASGGLLTLGARGGTISGVNTSGVSQNDAISNQILTGVQGFTKRLLQLLPDTSIQGNIYTNIGQRDGIIVGGSIGGLSGQLKFSSAEEAITAIDLQIAKSLTGLSATMQTVLNSLTDPADLEAAIQFATTYDNLKKAFDSAFTSINETKGMFEPFTEALDQIDTTFKELTRNAIQFGLSLEPIDAGLVEATKRLKDDFKKAVIDVFAQIVPDEPSGLFATFEKASEQLGTAFKDSITTGGALGLTGETSGIFGAITDANNRLWTGFYKSVGDALNAIAPQPVDTFAVALDNLNKIFMDATATATELGLSVDPIIKQTSDALQQLWAIQTESLRQLKAELTTGESSGLTGAAMAKAANDNFVRTLQLVKAGATGEIGNLAPLGAEAIAQSRAAYGQGPMTAALRTMILAAIEQIMASPPAFDPRRRDTAITIPTPAEVLLPAFANGTSYSPGGWSLVGEKGPEWVNLSRGATVLPTGVYPTAGGDMQTLLMRVVELLSQGNNIGRQGFVETIEAVEEVAGAVRTRPVLVEPTRTAA